MFADFLTCLCYSYFRHFSFRWLEKQKITRSIGNHSCSNTRANHLNYAKFIYAISVCYTHLLGINFYDFRENLHTKNMYLSISLTHFKPVSHFYTPLKCQKWLKWVQVNYPKSEWLACLSDHFGTFCIKRLRHGDHSFSTYAKFSEKLTFLIRG